MQENMKTPTKSPLKVDKESPKSLSPKSKIFLICNFSILQLVFLKKEYNKLFDKNHKKPFFFV